MIGSKLLSQKYIISYREVLQRRTLTVQMSELGTPLVSEDTELVAEGRGH